MKRQICVKTYEEAKELAMEFLWEDRKEDNVMSVTNSIDEDDRFYRLFSVIKDDTSGATAVVNGFHGSTDYSVTYFTPEELSEESRIYPYRNISKDLLLYLLSINLRLFKPTKEFSSDEVLTPEGLSKLYSFCGETGCVSEFKTAEQIEAMKPNIADAFENFDNGNVTIVGALLYLPLPSELTKLTKVKVKCMADYVKGISKLLDAKLTKEQVKAVEHTYIFYASEALLKYAIWEFFRTEDYDHLQQCLKQYKKFYLPDDWSSRTSLLRGYARKDPEVFVLGKYLNPEFLSIPQRDQLRDIAEYTNTPLSVILKASKEQVWEF